MTEVAKYLGCAWDTVDKAVGRWGEALLEADTDRVGAVDALGLDETLLAVNNLIKRVKRVAFGFRNFRNYRTRALLYAGKPNPNLLPTLTPP